MDVMIDIETMSSRPNAAIASIGAVKFDPYAVSTEEELRAQGNTFEMAVDMESQPDRHFDGNTLYWWFEQSQAARNAITVVDRVPLKTALRAYELWYKGVNCWCFGATFDHVIMQNAFDQHGMRNPAHYRNQLCARTISRLSSVPRPELTGTTHRALDDAIVQALWLQQQLASLRQK